MEKRNKIKMGCEIFLVIALLLLTFIIVRINKDFGRLQESSKSTKHSTAIEFKDIDQTIFITTSAWGLLGQHSHTIISDKDFAKKDLLLNKSEEIVFDDMCGLYYRKQEPDTLFIFLSSGSYSEEKIIDKKIGHINVRINKFKASMNSKYENNYKDMGLSKVDCYDGIE